MDYTKIIKVKPSKEVIEGCILLSDRITFDKMADTSFMRERANKELNYILDNIDKIIQFEINAENADWGSDDGFKVNIELRDRENYVTYLLLLEINRDVIHELTSVIEGSIVE